MALELIGGIIIIWFLIELIFWILMDELKVYKEYELFKGIAFKSSKKIDQLEKKQRIYKNIRKCIRMLIAIILILVIVIELLVLVQF